MKKPLLRIGEIIFLFMNMDITFSLKEWDHYSLEL